MRSSMKTTLSLSFNRISRHTSSAMGNFCMHFCPTIYSRLLSRSAKYHPTSSNDDTSMLCHECPREIVEVDASVPPVLNAPVTPVAASVNPHSGPKTLIQGPKILHEYVNFPFLTDDELATWIVRTRFMFIMRGPPGSGKSFIAECIKSRFPTAKICSADNFWYLESNGEEYQFDIARLDDAHNWCYQKALEAAESGVSPLVIDNTNVRGWETRCYTDLARRFRYTVIMVTPQTPWRFDTEALAMRNVHFVGLEAIESKVRNFEHIFPLYYGWLWPGEHSQIGPCSTQHSTLKFDPTQETTNLLQWAWDSLLTIVGLPDVRVQLASAFGLSDSATIEELLQHWYSATEPEFGRGLSQSKAASIPHITAKYARYGRAPNAHQYGQSGVVTHSLLGRLFTVQITGLFVSVRTVGARIRLPSDDLVLRHLWAAEDQAVLSSEPMAYTGDYNGFVGKSQNYRPIGCRAHVTLALAPDVSAVETGFDLLRIVDAELAYQPGDHMAIVPGGSVRRVTVRKPATSPKSPHAQFGIAPPGHEYMYVLDLDHPQHHRVLFAGIY